MKKAIYTNFTPYFVYTAKLLRDDEICAPCYWLVNQTQLAMIKEAFPDCEYHLFTKAIKGFQPENTKYDLLGLIDEPLLAEHAYTESIVLDMMNRNDVANNYSYYERKKVYKHYLSMSVSILNRHQPDIAFFTEEPHQPFIYILYRECVRRAIETQMFTRTSFLKRMVPLRQFEDGPIILNEHLSDFTHATIEELPDDIKEVVEKMRGDYKSGMPSYMKWQYEKFVKRDLWLKTFISKISRNLNPININKKWKRLNKEMLTDQTHKSKGFFQTMVKRKNLQKWQNEVEVRNKRLREYYESICNPSPDLSCNYIFLTLHYQPERSTSPMGLQYVDQLLVAELLAQNLPPGWKLYIKEHITQFVISMFGNQTRNMAFYDRFNALPNTELMPLNFSSFDLIDHCMATAAVTGTVVFEGIVRGKPGAHFGLSWYNGCYGTRFIRSSKDVQDFYSFVKKFEYNENKLFGYLQWFAQNSYTGTIGNKQTERQGLTQKENGYLHYLALKQLLN